MSESIGMMEGAFFVPRTQLLQWINTTFDLNLQKVEQCASAAVYCQIMDALYPGKVAMGKVNWSAKHEYEFVKNFKVLQDCFDKAGIQKHIEVEKLVKAKYQDNLEMLQWMKRYFDIHVGERQMNYDALERRKGGVLPDWAKGGFHKNSAAGAVIGGGEKENKAASNSKMPIAKKAAAPKEAAKGTVVKTAAAATGAAAAKTEIKPVTAVSGGKCGECEKLRKEMQETVEGAERERDFYFGKLRDIEIMCQTASGEMMNVKDILKILYKNDDEVAAPQETETHTHTTTEVVQPVAVEQESF
eukprot:GDKI01027588.1.p2 GENE.GDKI01027588.1~~GDKI01027588.1.p2  ORF type:complete len:301 (-),score=135.65 GDKI01027588.1:22-924(-)